MNEAKTEIPQWFIAMYSAMTPEEKEEFAKFFHELTYGKVND